MAKDAVCTGHLYFFMKYLFTSLRHFWLGLILWQSKFLSFFYIPDTKEWLVKMSTALSLHSVGYFLCLREVSKFNIIPSVYPWYFPWNWSPVQGICVYVLRTFTSFFLQQIQCFRFYTQAFDPFRCDFSREAQVKTCPGRRLAVSQHTGSGSCLGPRALYCPSVKVPAAVSASSVYSAGQGVWLCTVTCGLRLWCLPLRSYCPKLL